MSNCAVCNKPLSQERADLGARACPEHWWLSPEYCGTLKDGCTEQWVRFGTENFCHWYNVVFQRDSGINRRVPACREEFPDGCPFATK
jgi:hypothetical protein